MSGNTPAELIDLAATFSINPLDSLSFDPLAMTVCGCDCAGCRAWKTVPQNRKFWRLRAALTGEQG